MPDNKTKRKPQDASRINLNQPYEVDYWCKHFGCSEDRLRKAVDEVGTSKDAVEKYLNR